MMKDLDRAKKCMYVCTHCTFTLKRREKKAQAAGTEDMYFHDRQNSWIHLAKDAQSLGMHA